MSRAQVEQNVREKSPFLWLNEHWQPLERARVSASLTIDDVQEADWKLKQFAGLLTQLFPELRESAGLIESPLLEAERFAQKMLPGVGGRGRWFIKADHALPVAGSIKARGGLYEVLLHAEALALREGVLGPDDERHVLAGPGGEGHTYLVDHRWCVRAGGRVSAISCARTQGVDRSRLMFVRVK